MSDVASSADLAVKAASLQSKIEATAQSIGALGVARPPVAVPAAVVLSNWGVWMRRWLEAWATLEGKTLRELMAAFEEDQDE